MRNNRKSLERQLDILMEALMKTKADLAKKQLCDQIEQINERLEDMRLQVPLF